MISIDSEQVCLLELVKASLLNLSPEIPPNVNWEKVLESAKAQCVVSLLESHVPIEYRSEWHELSFQSKAHYMQMLYEQNNLINLFRRNSIPLIIIKGTASAIYFPVPSARTFGDVDLYVSKDYWSSAIKILEDNDYRLINTEDRHYEYVKNGIEFELHSKIGSKHFNDIEHIFINGYKNAVEYRFGEYSFPGLPKYENGLVLLGHIMQHLKASGIGLRQIIDWMMFVHTELDDSAWFDRFRFFAQDAGLEKLAITVTYMCKKWIGLNDNITWCNDADDEVADQLLIRILDDGNLGHNRALCEGVKKSINNEGLVKHLRRLGIENWSLSKKCVFFKPFAWLYQLFRYAGKGITGLFTGKKVFMKNKHNLSLEELWERLE